MHVDQWRERRVQSDVEKTDKVVEVRRWRRKRRARMQFLTAKRDSWINWDGPEVREADKFDEILELIKIEEPGINAMMDDDIARNWGPIFKKIVFLLGYGNNWAANTRIPRH